MQFIYFLLYIFHKSEEPIKKKTNRNSVREYHYDLTFNVNLIVNYENRKAFSIFYIGYERHEVYML